MKRTWPDELTCAEVCELVTAYDEGALPADERRLFEAHLGICPDCVRYCDQLRTAGLIACHLDHDHGAPLDPAIEAMLVSVFRSERPPPEPDET